MKKIKDIFKFNRKKIVEKPVAIDEMSLKKPKQEIKKNNRNPALILEVMDNCIEQVRNQIKDGSYFPQKQLQAYTKDKKTINDAKMSYDNAISGIMSNQLTLGMSNFPGFSFLSQITQNPWIRKVSKSRAESMTKEFGTVSTHDTAEKDTATDLEKQIIKYKVKKKFEKAVEYTGYFGGCKLYIDVRINGEYPSDEELKKPLFIPNNEKYNKAKIPAGSFYGLELVEPINCYPGTYNSSEPIKENFMVPEHWLVYGKAIHKSRFLHFIEGEVVFTLKPVYQFYGISLSQLVLPYIVSFEENLFAMNKLMKRFSKTYVKTNVSSDLAPTQLASIDTVGGSFGQATQSQFKTRMQYLADDWENNDIVAFTLDESVENITISLSGVNEIVESNLSFISMIIGKSRTSFLGDTPSGLNASGESELRRDQATLEEERQALLTEPMQRLLEILQLNLGKDIDDSISWKWGDLYTLSEEELIEMFQIETESGIGLIQNGVISPQELRDKIAKNPNSKYNLNGEIPDIVNTGRTDIDNILTELDKNDGN